MTIELTILNELLSEKSKSKYLQNTEYGHIGVGKGNYDGVQGEYNEYFKFYKHPELPEGVFMRETWQTDSYADNDSIVEIQFVQGKEKQVTVFEPINK